MAFVVGLDLGTRTIKGAVFTGTSRSYRLVDFFVEDIPLLQDTEVALGAAADGVETEIEAILSPEEILHRVLESRKLVQSDIYAALDAKDCGIRDIPLPYTRDDQIQKTVAFEAEHYFHAFDINDVTLEWVKVGESEGVSHLVLIAARNAAIEERLALLKRAEVDPVILDLDSAALANAFLLSSHYDETKSTLLVDMGATSTKIVLIESGKLKKIRSLRTGTTVLDPGRMIPEPLTVDPSGEVLGGGAIGGSVESAFESRLREFENAVRHLDLGAGDLFNSGVDLEAQESRADTPIAILSDEDFELVERDEVAAETGAGTEKAEAGAESAPEPDAHEPEASKELAASVAVAETDEEVDDYHAYLDRVGVEIQRTLATTQLEVPIELICLTGGMSRREEARRYFQEGFDIETVRLDFRGSLETDLDEGQLDLVASEGAVAVGLAARGLGKGLVQLDFRKGPYRFEHRLERVRVPLLVCSILCFFVFLQTAFWSFHEFRYERDHAVAYEQASLRVHKTFFDRDPVPGRTPLESARAQQTKWDAGGMSDVGTFLPYVEVIRDVGKVMASTGLYFKLSSVSYKFGLSRTTKRSGRDKKEAWRSAGDSQLVLLTEDSRALLQIENAFERSPKSDFFVANTDSTPQSKGDFKVTVKLKVAPKILEDPTAYRK